MANAEYPLDFAEFQMDVLREVGNIGSGNAATALSRLLKRPVQMLIPQVNIIPFEHVAESAGGAEQVVVAVFMRVTGDVPGNIFFLLDTGCAMRLLNDILRNDYRPDVDFTEMELSTLEEIGNILVGSYLSSLADLTRLRMALAVPAIAVDMAGAILNYGLIQSGQSGMRALVIETKLLEGEASVESQVYFIPDPQYFPKLFQALDVPYQ